METLQDVFKRCNEFISYLKDNYSDKTILVVTHSTILRVIHHILYKTDLSSDALYFKVENCYYEEIDI